MTLLEVNHLTVEYHTEHGKFRAVEDLTFHLEAGQSLGLVGESGCGKTTAMLALMRLLPESGRIVNGEVRFRGTDLLRLPLEEMRRHRWRDISMVFQGAMNALNPTHTVGSQVAEAILVHNSIPRKHVQHEVENLFDLVGISRSRIGQYPHQYSGGMRQRAMIAMALACRPDILIADEPTTALDVMIQAQILDLLQQLQKELEIGIVLVTHDLGVVAEICDDVLVMYAGRLAEYASSDVIFNNPSHPYTQRLLLAFPDIHDPGADLASIAGHPPALDNLPRGCRFEPRCHHAVVRCSEIIPNDFEETPGHLVHCLRVEAGEI